VNSRISVALLLLLLYPFLSKGQSVSDWFGTWHLDLPHSEWKTGPAPYARGTWKIERAGDGVRMIYDLVGTRGGITHMEWTGQFDARDYPLQGADAVVTYAYTQVDARTLDLLVTVDGNVAMRGRLMLSADGRSLTSETPTTKTVYVKR
jgi:hypothetical protein